MKFYEEKQNSNDSEKATRLFQHLHSVPSVTQSQHTKRHAISPRMASQTEYLTLYQEMRPILLALRMIGIFPYHVTSSGELTFSVCSGYMLYSLIIVMGITVIAAFVEFDRHNTIILSESKFEVRTLEYSIRIFIASVLLVPLTHWPETKKKVNFLNNWKQFQREFLYRTRKPLNIQQRKTIFAFIFVGIPLLIFFNTSAYTTPGICLRWWHIFAYMFAYAVAIVLPFLWIYSCKALVKAARILSTEIENHISSNGYVKPDKIMEYRRLWIKLSRLTVELGNSVGLTLGGHILLIFTLSVLLSYCFLLQLSEQFIYALFCIVLVFQAVIYVVCNTAQSTTEEVNRKILCQLEGLVKKIPAHNSSALYEIRAFLSTVARNPSEINFSGFVYVNRGLVTSFLSAMVTYLVVLMQFEIGETSQDKMTTATSQITCTTVTST